jgi:zinc protease
MISGLLFSLAVSAQQIVVPYEKFTPSNGLTVILHQNAANFESNSGTAEEIADLVLYNLPDTYFNTYVEKVLAVNKKGVEAAAKKYIVPENMLIVIVGDRAKIEEGIKKLNLGKVTFLSIEDVPGKKPAL